MQRTANPRLKIERLEERSVPAVLAGVLDGTLTVRGSATNIAADIRIDAQSGPVRVFDGATQVGVFHNIKRIVAQPDANVNLNVHMGYGRYFDALNIRLSNGVNHVQLTGNVNAATVNGGAGIDRIAAAGLNAQLLNADTGIQNDSVTIRKSQIGWVTINSAEVVNFLSAELGQVNVVNYLSPATFASTAFISHDLYVSQRGGSMTLGGSVAGNVTFDNGRGAVAANLRLNGTIAGHLSMVGTNLRDNAELAIGSYVAGDVRIGLGEGADRLTLAGTIGQADVATHLTVDLGNGDDNLSIIETSKIFARLTSLNLGGGSDHCFVAKESYYVWLNIDAGAGVDTLVAPGHPSNLADTNFEMVS